MLPCTSLSRSAIAGACFCVFFLSLCTAEKDTHIPDAKTTRLDPVQEAYTELERMAQLQARLNENVARIASYVRNGDGDFSGSNMTTSSTEFTNMLIDDLDDVKNKLLSVGRNLNHTMFEIKEAGKALKEQQETIVELKEHEHEFQVREAIRDGQVAVDYVTGKIDIKNLEKQEHQDSRGEFLQLITDADPAMLHLDIDLLQDVVVLCLATSFMGVLASSLRLPVLVGYLTAGMLVGPSCLGAISKVVQVETLAQFGSMFILFSRGLTYSSHAISIRNSKLEQSSGLAQKVVQKSTTVAVVFVCTLLVLWACCIQFLGIAGNFVQSLATALCFVLPATSSVIEFISHASLRGTTFSNVVLQFCRVLELAMAAMLVAPAIIRHMFLSFSFTAMLRLAVLESLGLLSIFIISRSIFPLLLNYLLAPRAEAAQHSHTETETEGSHPALSPSQLLNRTFDLIRPSFLFARSNLAIAPVVVSQPNHNTVSSRYSNMHAPDTALFAVVAYCTGLSMLTEWMELSADAGAFFAGLVLLDASHIEQASTCVEPLTSFFGGLYLASIGMITSPLFLLEHFVAIFGCVVLVMILKLILGFFFLRLSFGFDSSKCAAVTCGLCNISEVGVFVCARAHRLDLISRKTYLLTIASIVLCLAIAPPVSQALLTSFFPTLGFSRASNEDILVDTAAPARADLDSTLPAHHRRKGNKSLVV